jgi:hypothetical protein
MLKSDTKEKTHPEESYQLIKEGIHKHMREMLRNIVGTHK